MNAFDDSSSELFDSWEQIDRCIERRSQVAASTTTHYFLASEQLGEQWPLKGLEHLSLTIGSFISLSDTSFTAID